MKTGFATIISKWIRRNGSPVAHAKLKDIDGTNVEFQCGETMTYGEMKLPTTQTRQCARCHAYIKNAKVVSR